ncbi:UNVERIFIED_CONTAM: hypothetical protein Slati_0836400 [Sesamum latifolium]|uniref:Retrotransposon gag domain-containing protein n=1 Tax=Sesamum latifolium TaxID=2727402 RepID=A0AAW2XLQ4_9LAMI
MNNRLQKTAAFLFTIRQKKKEPLRDYMQRFLEAAVHEVPHVNHELLASIIQQNLLPGRFKESVARKAPSTIEDLIMRSSKYIRIEESNASDPSLGVKRMGREEEKEPKKKEERKHEKKISFSQQDLDLMRNQNNDALVNSATLSNFWVKNVLVDSGSSTDIIFNDAYVQLGIDNVQLRKVNTSLTGFSTEMIEPLGELMLPLSLGSYPKRSTKMVKFLVVKAPSRLQYYLGETKLKPLSRNSIYLPHET